MDKFVITGGKPLYGEVVISGAKNAALPIMTASILCSGELTIDNIPFLADIVSMNRLLLQLGVEIQVNGYTTEYETWSKKLVISGDNINDFTAPYELVRKMRASIIVLGPLLARFGRAVVSLPGGCAIGTRPVDLHLEALKLMGANIKIEEGYIYADAPNGLSGAEINFAKASVGATENIMMAASLASGKTIINNAAREPEIIDLARCLNSMGAKITGEGTEQIIIEGVNKLRSAAHTIIPDRIEAATFAAIAGITNGEIHLHHITAEVFNGVKEFFVEAGITIAEDQGKLVIKRSESHLRPLEITTNPFPGFPTDAQAQFMAMMTIAKGKSIITETVFENRFMHVPELIRMGADIGISGNTAVINGVNALNGAEVMSTDLRASVSLIIAALSSPKETAINRVYHLDRGYDRIEAKLQKLGANISRIRSVNG
ncbi:UDP-N-acetylglucosamine 1-carboxyvinyltransferase [Rickettsiales endosymbiont of Stachyamoeba lipophora]|uniref:UDP-N-acetylglucosamine 1-carboxyvinyltransferase n=1 Tax=Rickettsiales endosymbiont of Stachyamoeba lipophora TaxID=2486578 RepID=UPI000F651BE9|nr:UDP-N-acetylglucosamine 1-carboxyvinyltransferase [Rickettsiales endosymbiont of Stachyamoeba lipophora]AZL15253.1 UDP-N-acetylglucosamine 1-carboxyvinyltransferase [Rickettsiales endosymbiont of Stachyamoeba lipophora]